MKISRDLSAGVLHPREALFAVGVLGALNAEITAPADGSGVVSLDLRGTFNLTVEVSGTVDGTNWFLIPMRNEAGGPWLAAVVGSAAGVWKGTCTGYRTVRARVSAYTSGAATANLLTSTSLLDDFAARGGITTGLVTNVGAAGAAVTLTLTSPGAGLRHYLTYISINRFASALLVAAAVPVTVTTTNLPGTMAFSFPAEAAAQGAIDRYREDFAYPIQSVAQATATTIVCPATTNVIWRVSAGFLVSP
jgi:hypothetical protein